MFLFLRSHYPITLWSLIGYSCGIFLTQTALLFSPGSSGMEKVASHCEFLIIPSKQISLRIRNGERLEKV
ncbi:hypothetical protein HD_0953 [[Haemophilus] ducreyi 35000HP]|uniref:Uncharacterized protein n=1 Tax=Haemophilus ducreyi (strain 35000HP / ATCC 700724) TaxID=233412 RepID=Q7VMM2_HAEDU|nr:hypothetical protein HD_0953 [[Haemophilus] ducreyi 35000HP]